MLVHFWAASSALTRRPQLAMDAMDVGMRRDPNVRWMFRPDDGVRRVALYDWCGGLHGHTRYATLEGPYVHLSAPTR